MYYPTLRPRSRKRVRIDRFRGYDHNPDGAPGSFYEMENLSTAAAPLLSVRKRRTAVTELDGSPAASVLALGGKGEAVILDKTGCLWAGGNVLPRILPHSLYLRAEGAPGFTVTVLDRDAILAALDLDGSYEFVYDRDNARWIRSDGRVWFSGTALSTTPQEDEGDRVTFRLTTALDSSVRRSLVFLGGWVCVFPDGVYANAVRLRQGQEMELGIDWGSIALENACSTGSVRLTPCGADGTEWEIVWSDSDPGTGLWVDTSEPEPVLRAWSESQGLWTEVTSYVKCRIPGIAKGVLAGDGVRLRCRLSDGEPGAEEAEALWDGSYVLTDAWHDPGALNRPEGTDDYVILPGLLSAEFETQLTAQGRDFFSLERVLPEMDFVVECQNRLWGCRCGNGINELYGCKLGDFRNWEVFEGLSTDSWRVSRGHGGPFTGAAVLGGSPLFFREDSLEKIYPAAAGNHGVVTVSLSGIESGSALSAVVIRDRLYYKAREGICCYGGALPVCVSEALGREPLRKAVAGALGDCYCVSLEDARGIPTLYVLDTRTGLWAKEDGQGFGLTWSFGGRLYYAAAPGNDLSCIGEAADSDGIRWYAETGWLEPDLPARRYLSRLQITGRLDHGAELRVFLSYDGGPWQRAGTFRRTRAGAEVFPVFPRRCGRLRLRLEGQGGMELESMSWLTEAGSDV